MAAVSIQDGVILLRNPTGDLTPSAEEIYAVVFESATSIRSVPIHTVDLTDTGLDFSSFPADPVVRLEMVTSSGPLQPFCRLVARAGAGIVDIPQFQGSMLDYVILDKQWIPLPLGTMEMARSFLEAVGLSTFGPITFAQYLRIQRMPNPGLIIEDCTADSLTAANIGLAAATPVPDGIQAQLYPYQIDGYRWLSYMSQNDLGAVIADEMGLGKTLQVICLLLESSRRGGGPCLVISPATLLENWRRELQRFAPSVRTLVHSGPRRAGLASGFADADVVLASFETAVADISLMRNIKWDILVIDEAQGIKNPQARRSVQLRTLKRRCAIAITGTPVENRLTDLWSIVDFAIPSLLGTLSDFQRRHPDSIDGAVSLEPVVSPVILRRTVTDVADDLPERVDIPQPLELDLESAAVYESLRSEAADAGGNPTFASLVSLRMFCAHPWLRSQFTHIPDAAACSVKFRRLVEIMDEIVQCDGKALVFSSYQQSIDLIATELARRFGIHVDAIDGRVAVSARQPKVDAFSCVVGSAALVLNPKAAGTGLNITAANHVIHYNLEWNPAVEDQASARAHRRGQTRPVTVHRLYYINTVEDVINDRMQRKRALSSAAIVGIDGSTQETEDIMRALRVSPVSPAQEDKP